MKRIILPVFWAVMACHLANAQPGKLGGGMLFSTGYHFKDINSAGNKSGNLALTFKHVHKITVPIEFSPSFVFFYPHILNNLYEKTSIWTMLFDFDGHYIFNSLNRFEFYGVLGPNLLVSWKRDTYAATAPNPITGQPTGSEVTYKEKDRALGINLGAGSYMKLTDQFDLYFELKYLLSKRSQFIANAGILINIDWLKKHENSGIN
jgi:hypothetical protein